MRLFTGWLWRVGCATPWLWSTAGCAPSSGSAASHASAPRVLPNAGAVAATTPATPPACSYRVSVATPSPLTLSVNARCEGGTVTGFAPSHPALLPFVRMRDAEKSGAPLIARLPVPGVAELTYTVDLAGLATRADDIDVARHFGASVLAPASSFLLVPTPPEDGIPAQIHFDSPGVETGLRAHGDGYGIESHELKVATYTAFGAREARDVALDAATVRLVVLDGKLDLSLDELARWVRGAADGVATFFGKSPEPRTLVVLAPLPGRHGIAFGKLLPESAPGLVILIGEHTTKAELHADWVLVHELFHVGTPSYLGEGKWYDEGLATYFEPLIRARLGWLSEAQVWSEFLREMPRGRDALTRLGLENPAGYSDIYWGGGLFCLLADLEVRRTSFGARGHEDGVRAVFDAGGIASEVWTLARATQVTDGALGTPILAKLQAEHASHGGPLDLDAVFRELGVKRGPKGAVVLDKNEKTAALRRAIVYGTPKEADTIRGR